MRFFNSIVIGASALAALVSAEIAFTDAPNGSAEAGQTYTLKWTGDENQQATILLRKGPSNALVTVATITSDATGGSFSWTVPKDLAPAGDYALQITANNGDTNYWNVGAIAGGVAATTTNSAASSAASSASSSASSILSSASSKISSLSSKLSSVTASSTSAGTATVTSSRNSTSVTRATLTSTSTSGSISSTGTSSSTASSSSTTSAPSNDGVNLKSNAALVLGAVAAMAYLG